MRTITVEEHFATPLFLDGPGHRPQAGRRQIRRPRRKAHRSALRHRREAHRRDGCGRHRHADPVADLARHRAARRRRGDRAGAGKQRRARRSGEKAPDAVSSLRGAADDGPRQGRGRARSPYRFGAVQGCGDQRPYPRPLSRRQVLLADPGMRRKTRRADPYPSDASRRSRCSTPIIPASRRW